MRKAIVRGTASVGGSMPYYAGLKQIADEKVRLRTVQGIKRLRKALAEHAGKLSGAPQYEPGKPPQLDNLIMLGDFNIFNREDVTMEAITDAGFIVPPELQSVPGSNVAQNKHYDQIAYYKQLSRLKSTGRAGVFDFFEHVYRDEDEAAYAQERAVKPGKNFADWRTYRMSDHLPMWIEFGIDDGDGYLDALAP